MNLIVFKVSWTISYPSTLVEVWISCFVIEWWGPHLSRICNSGESLPKCCNSDRHGNMIYQCHHQLTAQGKANIYVVKQKQQVLLHCFSQLGKAGSWETKQDMHDQDNYVQELDGKWKTEKLLFESDIYIQTPSKKLLTIVSFF